MTLPVVDSDRVAARLSLIRPYLDERAWRLLLGAEAKVLGTMEANRERYLRPELRELHRRVLDQDEEVLIAQSFCGSGAIGFHDLGIHGQRHVLLGASGQNIYPEEIEDKLNSLALVAESVVVQKGD